jgi:alpha-1,6-mannosyltransferase
MALAQDRPERQKGAPQRGGRLGGVKAFLGRDFNRELAAWGVLLELALLLFWGLSGVWRGSPGLVWAFFIPGAVWGAVCWRVLRRRCPPHAPAGLEHTGFACSPRQFGEGVQRKKRTRAILLGFAAVFHLTMLLTPHPLSNDLYRYAWDGKLLALGINPYAYPPGAEALSGLHDAGWEQIFNRDVPTGYPPLSEALFAAAYRLGGAAQTQPGRSGQPPPSGSVAPDGGPLWVLRGMAVLASLGAAALLMQAMNLRGSDERRVVIYAWAPLVAVEFANSGHLDVYAISCLSAALVCSLGAGQRQRGLGTAVFLALGGLAKFYPAMLAPLWGRRWGWPAWAAFLLVSGLGWLPFLFAGLPLAGSGLPFAGLGIFALRGDFNGGVYRLIEAAWFWLLDTAYARVWAKATVAALLGLAYLRLLRRAPGVEAVDWRGAGGLVGLALLLSPVVHPWYFCWMLAFSAIEGSLAWLVVAVTAIFARTVYVGYEATGVWLEAGWTAWVVWLPFYLAVTWEWMQTWLRRAPGQPDAGEDAGALI